jgi:hypothetical protein
MIMHHKVHPKLLHRLSNLSESPSPCADEVILQGGQGKKGKQFEGVVVKRGESVLKEGLETYPGSTSAQEFIMHPTLVFHGLSFTDSESIHILDVHLLFL